MMGNHEKTNDFWIRLIEARRERGLPVRQVDIGKAAGVKQSAVTKWKRGESLPVLDTVRTLAVEVGVCVEWLLTGRGSKYPTLIDNDAATVTLLEIWSHLIPETRRLLLGDAALARTLQNTATAERNTEVHQQIVSTSERLRAHEPRSKYHARDK